MYLAIVMYKTSKTTNEMASTAHIGDTAEAAGGAAFNSYHNLKKSYPSYTVRILIG